MVLITQTWPIFYFSFFANKVFRRSKNSITITLGSFFIINAIAYFLSILSIISILLNIPLAFSFYLISYYLFVFSPGLLVIFSYLLLLLDKKVHYVKYHVIIFVYLIAASFVLWFSILFNGIQYSFSTDWYPVFSWLFFGMTTFYAISFLIIPEAILGLKLTKMYKNADIQIRIKKFLLSAFIQFIIILSTTLFNTWHDNQIYRALLPVVNLLLGTLAAFLIYQSFGVTI